MFCKTNKQKGFLLISVLVVASYSLDWHESGNYPLFQRLRRQQMSLFAKHQAISFILYKIMLDAIHGESMQLSFWIDSD